MLLREVIQPSLPVSALMARSIDIIDTHDFSGVKRKVREDMLKLGKAVNEEWLDAGILALKQYYVIAVLDRANMHAVSEPVDPFWHAHILHTKQYAEFCQEIAGRFLHHEPLDHAVQADVQFVGQLYEYTMKRYNDCFTVVDSRFHPRHPTNAELVCTHGPDDGPVHSLFPSAPEAQPRALAVH